MRDRGGAPCRTRALVAERLAELEMRLGDLTELRDELQILLREWDRRLARIPVQSCRRREAAAGPDPDAGEARLTRTRSTRLPSISTTSNR